MHIYKIKNTIPSPQYYPHKNYPPAVQDKRIDVNPAYAVVAVAEGFQLQKQNVAVCKSYLKMYFLNQHLARNMT